MVVIKLLNPPSFMVDSKIGKKISDDAKKGEIGYDKLVFQPNEEGEFGEIKAYEKDGVKSPRLTVFAEGGWRLIPEGQVYAAAVEKDLEGAKKGKYEDFFVRADKVGKFLENSDPETFGMNHEWGAMGIDIH